jgi:hypothetical protein
MNDNHSACWNRDTLLENNELIRSIYTDRISNDHIH